MRRRTLLGAAASLLPAALAGCTGEHPVGVSSGVGRAPTASLEMRALSDAELPTRVLYTVENEWSRSRRAGLLDRILDGGATVSGTDPPLPADRHLSYDDAVYRLTREVTERTPATRYSVKIDVVQDDSVPDSETVNFSDLPKVDREIFAENGYAGGDVVGIGTTLLYTDAERERSALVPDSEYSVIVWDDGDRAEWVVDDASDTTLKTYRYVAERVAAAAEYGRRMRERFAFEFSNLSEEEVEIVESAVGQTASGATTATAGYVVGAETTAPPAMVSLASRFRDREQARGLDEPGEGDLNGSYLVRYDGEVYWTRLAVYGEQFATETGTATTSGTGN